MPLRIHALDHLVINVRDVEASAGWYGLVLGMRREDVELGGMMRSSVLFGDMKINLRPLDASQVAWFTAGTPCAGSDDLCFLTHVAPDDVVAHLQSCGVAIEAGPGPRRGARGTLHSVYCRDPDGNLIEISSYAD